MVPPPSPFSPSKKKKKTLSNTPPKDHCIEVLRQGVQCRGDVSLVTIRWQASQKIPVADFKAPHECVNFDALNEWSRQRRIDVMRPGLLVHPTLGVVYPEGKNPTVGAAETTEKFLPSVIQEVD
jgi:Mycotoxin biosynthesis protein UstYa